MSVESAAPAAEPELLIVSEGHVRILTLNRPERRNALSRSLYLALSEALIEADETDEVRVVVIAGAGEHAFCAGADLKDMRQNDDAGKKFKSPMARVDRTVFEIAAEMKKPTIAALNGSAVAGGFELALACDLRIAHPQAEFGLPEAKIGMGANFGSVALARRMPLAFALELLYTGDYISAPRAHELGLLNRLVAREQVLPESLALAQRIARNAPLSVRRMKAMALKGMELPLATALRLDIGPNPYLSEDRQEGIRARLEKRDPVWRGR
jgi:enoyl-CoA hydratase